TEKSSQTACQAKVEITRVQNTDDERLGYSFRQHTVESGLFVKEGLDFRRKQVGSCQANRFARARRRHEPKPQWVVASYKCRIREVSVGQASGVTLLSAALVLPSPGLVIDASGDD